VMAKHRPNALSAVGIAKLAAQPTQTGFVATSRRVNVLAKVFASLNESRGMRSFAQSA